MTLAEEDDLAGGDKRLCSPETFLGILGVEIERFVRYQRDFTIVLIRPQDFGHQAARLQSTLAASERVLGLLRTCDVITIFEENPFVVAFLPETSTDGAHTILERFGEHFDAQGPAWTLKAATYSERPDSIGNFLLWFKNLVLGLGHKTQSHETTPPHRYRRLSVETSDVTRSWRDL